MFTFNTINVLSLFQNLKQMFYIHHNALKTYDIWNVKIFKFPSDLRSYDSFK